MVRVSSAMTNIDTIRCIPPNHWVSEDQAENSRDTAQRRVGDVKEFFDWRKAQLRHYGATDKVAISVVIDKAKVLLSAKFQELSRAIEGGGADVPSIDTWCAERRAAVQRLEVAESRVAALMPLRMSIEASREYRGVSYWSVRAAFDEASSASRNLGLINNKIANALSGHEDICASIKSLENAVITDSQKIGAEVDRSNILFGDR